MPFGLIRHFDENNSSTGHLYLLRFIDKSLDFRNKFIEEMGKLGVSCNVHYKPLPMHTAYMKLGFDIEKFPNAYKMYENTVSLPLHTCLTNEQIDYIIESTLKLYRAL